MTSYARVALASLLAGASLLPLHSLEAQTLPRIINSPDPNDPSGLRQDNVVGTWVNFEPGAFDMMSLDPLVEDYLTVQNGPRGTLEIFYIPAFPSNPNDPPVQPLVTIPTSKTVVSIASRPGTFEVWLVDPFTRHKKDLPQTPYDPDLPYDPNGTTPNDPNLLGPTEEQPGGVIGIVDVDKQIYIETIEVGREPFDITFLPDGSKAYVSCSGDGLIYVIDTQTYSVVDRIVTGTLENSMPTGAFTLRALTHEPVSDRVYVASFLSGNNSAAVSTNPGVLSADVVVDLATHPGAVSLPDEDLFAIQVGTGTTPDTFIPTETRTEIGTTLYNISVDAVSGRLFIPNTNALNAQFQGAVNFPDGQVVENRVTIVDPSTPPGTLPVIVDLDALAQSTTATCAPGGSVGFANPTDVAIDPNGDYAYVACYGSDTIAVLDLNTNPIELGGYYTVPVAPGSNTTRTGPRTLEMAASGNSLWIYNLADLSVSMIDLSNGPVCGGVASTARPLSYDPTPEIVRKGRAHFINCDISLSKTSGCVSCHNDMHTDGLAWNLGNCLDPEGTVSPKFEKDHKGAMLTQTLRGLQELRPFHWRGEQKDLEQFAIDVFGPGGLVEAQGLPSIETEELTAFLNSASPWANSRQHVDRSYLDPTVPGSTRDEVKGLDLFVNRGVTLAGATCATCHSMPTTTNNENQHLDVFLPPARSFKVAHLRGLKDRIGRSYPIDNANPPTLRSSTGAGTTHAGEIASIDDFVQDPFFQNLSPQDHIDMIDFIEALDSGVAPSTGYLETVGPNTPALTATLNDIATFVQSQTSAGYADILATLRVLVGSTYVTMSSVYDPGNQMFHPPSVGFPPFTFTDIENYVVSSSESVTFIATVPGAGQRKGIDADMDGILDFDEALTSIFDYNPAADPTPPAFVLVNNTPVRELYSTTHVIKYEIVTNKIGTLRMFYANLDPSNPPNALEVDVLGPGREFQAIVSGLPTFQDFVRIPAGLLDITVEFTDAQGNKATTVVSPLTDPHIDPVKVESIVVNLLPDNVNPTTAEVKVNLSAGTIADFPIHNSIYDVDVFATYGVIDPSGGLMNPESITGGPPQTPTLATATTDQTLQNGRDATFIFNLPTSALTDPIGQRVICISVDHCTPTAASVGKAPYTEGDSLRDHFLEFTF